MLLTILEFILQTGGKAVTAPAVSVCVLPPGATPPLSQPLTSSGP